MTSYEILVRLRDHRLEGHLIRFLSDHLIQGVAANVASLDSNMSRLAARAPGTEGPRFIVLVDDVHDLKSLEGPETVVLLDVAALGPGGGVPIECPHTVGFRAQGPLDYAIAVMERFSDDSSSAQLFYSAEVAEIIKLNSRSPEQSQVEWQTEPEISTARQADLRSRLAREPNAPRGE